MHPEQRRWLALRRIERDLLGPPGNIRSFLDRDRLQPVL